MSRRPIFAANWKMNKTTSEAKTYCAQFGNHVIDPTIADVVICPPFPSLHAVRLALPTAIGVGAQTVANQLSGAYTGEIAIGMIADAGCTHVIVGHSERRALYHETPALLAEKLERVINEGLTAIFCVGETLSDRENGQTQAVLLTQLQGSLKPILAVLSDRWQQLVVAYEPVWAIGTGKVATVDQAQEAHDFIRSTLKGLLGPIAAKGIRIQYGGSVKPDNVKELMAQPDIDGALVGGASLDPESFYEIIKNGVTQ